MKKSRDNLQQGPESNPWRQNVPCAFRLLLEPGLIAYTHPPPQTEIRPSGRGVSSNVSLSHRAFNSSPMASLH